LIKITQLHKGIWNKDAKGSFELRGKTLGLIGYGNIGTQTSIMAEAMGMKVKFYDVETKLPLGNAQAVKSIKELVSTSDIISLHVPETASD
jgi:D-3-phosphoglycerate dehydrogenase